MGGTAFPFAMINSLPVQNKSILYQLRVSTKAGQSNSNFRDEELRKAAELAGELVEHREEEDKVVAVRHTGGNHFARNP